MSDSIELARREAWRVADSLAQISARTLEFRVANDTRLTDEEVGELEQLEDNLDHMVVVLRSRGVTLIGAQATQAVAELEAALSIGRQALDSIKDVHAVIRAASSLFELSVALLARNPGQALQAIGELKDIAGEYGIKSEQINLLVDRD